MIAALLLLALAPLHPGFELEVGGGIAHSLEPSSGVSDYPFAAPAFQARAAVDVSFISAGVTYLAIIGGEAPNSTGCCGRSTGHQAFSATATLFTLRVRSFGDFQLWAEGGAGTGHLISLQTD